MEYYAVDNQGEICVKGTNVFMGWVFRTSHKIYFIEIFN